MAIPEEDVRRGHRALRHDHSGIMTSKLKKRDRIATNKCRAIHPDALPAIDMLLKRGDYADQGAATDDISEADLDAEEDGPSIDEDNRDLHKESKKRAHAIL